MSDPNVSYTGVIHPDGKLSQKIYIETSLSAEYDIKYVGWNDEVKIVLVVISASKNPRSGRKTERDLLNFSLNPNKKILLITIYDYDHEHSTLHGEDAFIQHNSTHEIEDPRGT